MESGIPVSKFYGANKNSYKKPSGYSVTIPVPYKQKNLLSGPPLTWKVFKRQGDALDFMRNKGFGLMSFAFETQESRLFLVAHPEVFWHYDIQRKKENRCSYEIIPELSACKLYFDIEFSLKNNPNKDSKRMVNTFVAIVIYFLESKCGVKCNEEDALILDSTTEEKFSQHLIFNIPCVCFTNNYHVGNFISFIDNQILMSSESGALSESLFLSGVSLQDVCELIVTDNKGNKTVFCDECVYSKNRHFRMYGSTKLGKNSPLVHYRNPAPPSAAREKEIFLSSLITFIQGTETNKVINFGEDPCKFDQSSNSVNRSVGRDAPKSPYPEIDSFISGLVAPGRIFRSVFFSTSNVILYDIVGYRFCGNIGREHKSNNIKYVVDVSHCFYYQKCHDWDCVSYRSEKRHLPSELIFTITDSHDPGGDRVGIFSLPDQCLNDVLEAIETSVDKDTSFGYLEGSSPSNEEMNSVLDALEASVSESEDIAQGCHETSNLNHLDKTGSMILKETSPKATNIPKSCKPTQEDFNEDFFNENISTFLNSFNKSDSENNSDSQFPSCGLPDEAFLSVPEGMDF